MKKPVRNFLETAIKSLSKEDFDEAVRVFQKDYFGHESVNVDGCNDGGCDIKIFQGKRELRKCVQVTVNKTIENKLKTDLLKVDKLITEFGFSNKFEFYCNIVISEEKIEEYKRFARQKYDIDLDIYEAHRLSQLECRELTEYVYSLHEDVVIRPEELSLDKTTKVLYDLLACGKDSSDIKNGLYHSIIISVLYEKRSMTINDLKDEIERRLKKKLPDFTTALNQLRTSKRVIKDETHKDCLCLSDVESESVRDIIASSMQMEKEFSEKIAEILDVHNDEIEKKIIENLKNIYRNYYKLDIDGVEGVENDDGLSEKVFNDFKRILQTNLPAQRDVNEVIGSIKELCADNSYINRLTASESFLSLYKSDKLSQYISQKKKVIFLDTPSFVYLICACFYGEDLSADWNNSMYKSVKSLYRQVRASQGQITLKVMAPYLSEVSNELRKALQISFIESCPFADGLGESSNTFFNYYNYLKQHDLFEEDDKICCFEDFVYSLGFENLNPSDSMFTTDSLKKLADIAEDISVGLVSPPEFENFFDIRDNFEKLLYKANKVKSRPAANKDVNQVLYLLRFNSLMMMDGYTDLYLSTWDSALSLLRDDLLEKDCKKLYSYFYIATPATISNRIALESFKIDTSAITDEIFVYAEKRYDISNKMKNLIDLIAPVLGRKDVNHRLLTGLSKIRKSQLEIRTSESDQAPERQLPIEDALCKILPSSRETDQEKKYFEKFSSFMNDESNSEYILSVLSEIVSSMLNHTDYKLDDFKNKVINYATVVNVESNDSIN